MEQKVKELEAEVERLNGELAKAKEATDTWIRISNGYETDAKEQKAKLNLLKQLLAIL